MAGLGKGNLRKELLRTSFLCITLVTSGPNMLKYGSQINQLINQSLRAGGIK